MILDYEVLTFLSILAASFTDVLLGMEWHV